MATYKPIWTAGNRSRTRFQRAEKIQAWHYAVVFLLACVIVITRRPAAVLNPQFYAEDGTVWFADAYNHGWWRILFHTYHGYLHIVPRLAGAASLLVSIVRAPLVENLIAIAIQALPVCLLLSPRSLGWGTMNFRAVLAFVYLSLPNTCEMMASVTESQWTFALSAFLLMVGESPRSVSGRTIAISILLLSSLTGPFCIFLFPLALFLMWHRRKDAWPRVTSAILFIGLLIQGVSHLAYESARQHYVLGASFRSFAQILDSQIYLGTLLGSNTLSLKLSLAGLVLIAAAGSAMLVLCVMSSGIEMRLLLVFSVLLFVSALVSPWVEPIPGPSAWWILARSPETHYWFFPCLVFAWSLLWLFVHSKPFLKIIAGGLLLLMCVGIVRDWRSHVAEDLRLRNYAGSLAIAPQGTVVTIPTDPPGWQMKLIKK